MKSAFSLGSLLALGLGTAALVGCETSKCETDDGKDAVCADSLSEYTGKNQTIEVDYVDGASVSVDGIYGDVHAKLGKPGIVSVEFRPFNWRKHGIESEAKQEIVDKLELSAEADDDDNVAIVTGRHDSKNGLGAHIEVSLPPEFNGVLQLKNRGDGAINGGSVVVDFVGDATTLDVVNRGFEENCNILRGEDDEPALVSALIDTSVACDGDITVRGVSDDVTVESTGEFHSNVRVEIAEVSAGARGGRVRGTDSTIELIMPENDAFVVRADVSGGATLQGFAADALPDACALTADESSSREVTCGSGGPTYAVSTTDDATDDQKSFIRLKF